MLKLGCWAFAWLLNWMAHVAILARPSTETDRLRQSLQKTLTCIYLPHMLPTSVLFQHVCSKPPHAPKGFLVSLCVELTKCTVSSEVACCLVCRENLS